MSKKTSLFYLDSEIREAKQSLTPEEIFSISNRINDALGGKESIDIIVVPSDSKENILIYNLVESIAEAKGIYTNIINPIDLYRINDIIGSNTLFLIGSNYELNSILNYIPGFIDVVCIGKEKIDVITWSDNASEYIREALSPAEVIDVKIDGKKAKVSVSEEMQSIAIGKQGQNVRLASKLTGYDIDIELVKTTPKKKKQNIEDSLLSAIEETEEESK